MLNYDPDEKTKMPKQLIKEAAETGMRIVHVVCTEPNTKPEDASGVSFFAIVDFLPRAGDRIALEDGQDCQVVRTYFKVVTRKNPSDKTLGIALIPNVYAVLLEKKTP